MPFDFSSFVNPNQFSDAASYAGFDGGMKSVREEAAKVALATMGVPPEMAGAAEGASAAGSAGGASAGAAAGAAGGPSLGDAMMSYGKQAVAPYAQKFDQLSNAASQAGQGNFGNAFNAAVGRKVQQTQQAPTPQYDYSHEW